MRRKMVVYLELDFNLIKSLLTIHNRLLKTTQALVVQENSKLLRLASPHYDPVALPLRFASGRSANRDDISLQTLQVFRPKLPSATSYIPQPLYEIIFRG